MWLWTALIAFGGVVASLFWSRLTLSPLGAWFVVTVLATFVLPVITVRLAASPGRVASLDGVLEPPRPCSGPRPGGEKISVTAGTLC